MPFCRYCGNKIEEGEICSCEQAQAAAGVAPKMEAPVQQQAPVQQPVQQQMPVQPQNVNQQAQYQQGQYQQPQMQGQPVTISVDVNAAKSAAMGAWGHFLNMIKAPVTGSAAYITGFNRSSSLVLIFVQAIISSLFAVMYTDTINSLIGAANLFGGELDQYKFSNTTAFFVTLIFSLVTAAVFMAIFFCAIQISGCKITFAEVIDLGGVRATFSIPLVLLSIILKMLNPIAGAGCFYLSAILAAIVICTALAEKYPVQKNVLIYVLLLAIVVFILVSSFIYSKAAVLYVPESIKSQIGNLDSLADYLF